MTLAQDTIGLYFREIARSPLVNRDEEAALAEQIQNGSDDAFKDLVRSNLRLVVKIAHDFRGRGLPMPDLISEGNIGLMRAVAKFDPAKGAKLSSYAAWWIKQSMRRAIANQARTVRVPIQSATRIGKVTKVRDELQQELDRPPTAEEIAERIGLPVRTVSHLLRTRMTTVSLDAPMRADGQDEFRDIIPDPAATAPDEAVQQDDTIEHVMHLIDRLDARTRTILTLRYGLDGNRCHTLDEVSQIIGRTRERIRQIQNAAITQLREMLDNEELSNVTLSSWQLQAHAERPSRASHDPQLAERQ